MAKQLNKNRVRDTWLIALGAVGVFLFTEPMARFWQHELSEFIGFWLVLLCVFGRLYATVFIGGSKNSQLVTAGPFSVVRNPLYLFSLIGVAGIGLMSARLSVFVILMLVFYTIFSRMITREEAYLRDKFGKAYAAYCASTPRLWPRFTNYTSPKAIEVHPQYVFNAMKDSVLWFVPYFAFEAIDWLHATGHLPMLALLP